LLVPILVLVILYGVLDRAVPYYSYALKSIPQDVKVKSIRVDAPTPSLERPQQNTNPVLIEPEKDFIEIGDSRVYVDLRQNEISFDSRLGASNFASAYAALRKDALNGDVIALRSLAVTLRMCSEIPSTEKELDSLLEQLKPNDISNVDVLSKSYKYCEGITETDRKNYLQWASLGNESGDFVSYSILSEQIEVHLKQELHQKWWDEHKFVGAANYLSNEYQRGVMDDAGTRTKPDYIKSYAYFLVTEKLSGKFLEANNSQLALARIQPEIDERKSSIAINLSPQQQIEAEALAVKLLEDGSTKCCLVK